MNSTDPTIFKAYDIRGFYPSQINEDTAYTIARAVAYILKSKKCVIGKDVRLGSDAVYKSLIQGFLDSGCDVDYLGEVTSDSIYFAVGKYDYDLGIAITGSHNPKEYTGFKFTKKGVVPISGASGMEDIKNASIQNLSLASQVKGTLRELDLSLEYRDFVLSFIDKSKIAPLKICVDTGNGVAGETVLSVLSQLPCIVTSIYAEKDGNFPNHLPDPQKEENTRDLKKLVVDSKSDLGVSFDGDGDRMLIIDEKGNYLSGYYLTAMLAKIALKKHPGSKILHEPRLVWAIIDTIKENGGIPVMCRAGHSFIKEKMRAENVVFGGETTGHFFYKENYYADNGVISMLLFLEMLSQERKPLSEIIEKYSNKYPFAGEFNNKVSDPDLIISQIKANYSNRGYSLDETDGITVENGREWRFNVRKSNTEPLVRLNVEGKSKEIVDAKVKEVLNLIQN
ncbi:MAG: phosphomannomutase/phosphoglucomutase [Patescibacteria group bacterium]|nr:phosphomannomutase/phosphoglucomutase [Patescibacteria group bacterium]